MDHPGYSIPSPTSPKLVWSSTYSREKGAWEQQDNMHGDTNGDDDQQDAWWQAEIDQLKSSLKALNVQMFQERKTWLAEKTDLEKTVAALSSNPLPNGMATGPSHHAAGASSRSYSSSGSQSTGRHAMGSLERSLGVDRGPLDSGLRRSPLVDRSGSIVPQDDLPVLRAQFQAIQSSLAVMTSERDAAREQAAMLRAQAQQWNVERAALQREVEVLRASNQQQQGRRGPSDSGAADLMVALEIAEEEKAALASELELIKQSLKNNVLVPRSHMAQLREAQANNAAAAAAAGNSSSPGNSRLPSQSTYTVNSTTNADSAATIAKLNAEITRLQADLYILKDECVPVPKSEFASLKGVHTEKAGMEQELRSVRQELADVARLNKMLREEMELIKEEYMTLPMHEYNELRRAAAEKEALELKIDAQAKYYTQVPKDELADLQAARRSLAAVESKLAALQAVNSVAQGDMSRALQQATTELADLKVKLLESEAVSSELRKELQAAEGRAAVIQELQEKIRTGEAALSAAAQEKARLALRLRAVEDELEASKTVMKDAQQESARVCVELGSTKDACSSLAQEVSTLTRERGELESRVNALKSEREGLTNELVDAKLELARLREMEVLYRRSVLNDKKQLYGLPSTIATEAH